MDIYITQHYILVPVSLICGAVLLANAYSVATRIYDKKNKVSAKNLTKQEFKKEAIQHSILKCNALYIGLFFLFQYLVSFRKIYTFE